MPFYRVELDAERKAVCGAEHRILHAYKDEAIVETHAEPETYIEEVPKNDEVVVSHLEWYAIHPEEAPEWVVC
jgi:hypothetical protein